MCACVYVCVCVCLCVYVCVCVFVYVCVCVMHYGLDITSDQSKTYQQIKQQYSHTLAVRINMTTVSTG